MLQSYRNSSANEPSQCESSLLTFHSSLIHGTGGFARTSISKGSRVIEYVGERIDKRESLRRCEQNNVYIFSLGPEIDLDGDVTWNPARFLNHSCAPNCDAALQEGRLWIVANRDIPQGEEITFNYGFDLESYRDYPCQCGSPSCVGYIVAEEFFDHVRRRSGNKPG
jgi:SET domain-containing protein